MPRPKGSKNKPKQPLGKRPHNVQLVIPKDPLKSQAKRIYWLLLEMEKKMQVDITSVRIPDYLALVQEYKDISDKMKKEGYRGKYATKRVDKQGVVQDQSDSDTPAISGNGSASVGVGVPPFNPLA